MAIRKNKKATTGSVMGAVSGLFGDPNNRRNMADAIAMKKRRLKTTRSTVPWRAHWAALWAAH